jgi:serine/threonine protein kinase
VGDWELVQCQGMGEWSRVYSARPRDCAPDWPADYAVKVAISDDHNRRRQAAQLLAREATVGRAVTHPHLIAILSAQLESSPPFIVMPLMQGATLSTVLAQTGPLAAPQALWMARQTTEALAELHAGGWMHADVKPANIHVSPAGHATLIDLGFSLRLETVECAAGSPLRGSLAYTAPEMISSAVPVDGRCDIYSLGISLYELLAGHPPFQDRDPGRLMLAHLQSNVPNPRPHSPTLYRGIWDLLQDMLAKDPLRRPAASELLDRLVELEIATLEERVA